jgi:hypothetical protein
MVEQTVFGLQVGLGHIAHETAIGRNPPLRSFAGDKDVTDPQQTQHLRLSRFYENVRESKYCENHILTEGVFVT